MKHFAVGWACNLNEIFVRFPYEKCKNLIKQYKTKLLQRLKIKLVFRESVNIILEDIIDNNVTFKIQGIGYQGGEIHFEPIMGEEFKRVYSKGKFKGIDFLESLFTGYQMYLYIHGKKDDFLHRRKTPIYFGGYLKEKLILNVNQGKIYC